MTAMSHDMNILGKLNLQNLGKTNMEKHFNLIQLHGFQNEILLRQAVEHCRYRWSSHCDLRSVSYKTGEAEAERVRCMEIV